MSTPYQRILAARRDMTEWLIHFTHANGPLDARQVLGRILIEGALRPGFSPRGNPPRPTVYGTSPAVCFTEQPIGAFRQYLSARGETPLMDGYGLLVHKHDVFVAGGLPVIYGLGSATEINPGEAGYELGKRVLRAENLPLEEQYRYVAFSPTEHGAQIDWSHEREWRWSAARRLPLVRGLFLFGLDYINTGRGDFEGRVHAFVRTERDVGWLQEELETALVSGTVGHLAEDTANRYSKRWRKALCQVRVVSLEAIGQHLDAGNEAYFRYETIPEDAQHRLLSEERIAELT